MPESEAERDYAQRAEHGLAADIVLVCLRDGPRAVSSTDGEDARETVLTKLQAEIRTTTQYHTDGKCMLIKLTARRSRLVEEADRLRLPKLVDRAAVPTEQQARPAYAPFNSARERDFALSEGMLFSSLERQRLIFSMVERAGVDLDELCADKSKEYQTRTCTLARALPPTDTHWASRLGPSSPTFRRTSSTRARASARRGRGPAGRRPRGTSGSSSSRWARYASTSARRSRYTSRGWSTARGGCCCCGRPGSP